MHDLIPLGPALRTAAVVLALSAAPAFAYDAVVTACHDGDTCTLANGERIRLHAIDAPEISQPYGLQAHALINRLLAGQHVDVRPTGDHSYGRTVADLYIGGRSVGADMVAAGLAWVEPRWNTDASTPARQTAAQAAHLGLWADGSSAVPPWVWRQEHGGGGHSYAPHHGWYSFSGRGR